MAYLTRTTNQWSNLRSVSSFKFTGFTLRCLLRRTFLLLDRNFHEKPRTNKPQPGQENIGSQPLRAKTPLEGFFSRYPNFESRPSNPPTVEFDRLCELYYWGKGDREWKAARKVFNIALRKEFDYLYGIDEHDLKKWHNLCRVLSIDPVPDTPSLREFHAVSCRSSDPLRPWSTKASSSLQAVVDKYVNLVDLVHNPRKKATNFETEKRLSEYTIETEKYFPKGDAKDSKVLRALRRRIIRPRKDRSSSRRKKSNKGIKV